MPESFFQCPHCGDFLYVRSCGRRINWDDLFKGIQEKSDDKYFNWIHYFIDQHREQKKSYDVLSKQLGVSVGALRSQMKREGYKLKRKQRQARPPRVKDADEGDW